MEIQFPEAQFKKAIPPSLIPGWKRAYHRLVTRILIMYDRVDTAEADPTPKNITRAVCMGVIVGVEVQFTSKINNLLVSKKFPKDFEELCLDEARRHYKLDNAEKR